MNNEDAKKLAFRGFCTILEERIEIKNCAVPASGLYNFDASKEYLFFIPPLQPSTGGGTYVSVSKETGRLQFHGAGE